LADGDPTKADGRGDGPADEMSAEARDVLAAVLILERDNVHLERPRIRKDLIELIKNHVR
jgi:hypothetical protein